jgi:hypothetical protein
MRVPFALHGPDLIRPSPQTNFLRETEPRAARPRIIRGTNHGAQVARRSSSHPTILAGGHAKKSPGHRKPGLAASLVGGTGSGATTNIMEIGRTAFHTRKPMVGRAAAT